MRRQPTPVGARFNRLVILGDAPNRRAPNGKAVRYVHVRCDCGVTKQATLRALLYAHTTSCGCLLRERRYEQGTHHQTKTRTHRAWVAMHGRCRGDSPRTVRDYQLRGISVCARWTGPGGFSNFLADMGERPAGKRVMLDRIDNDGNYEPSNCRWTTAPESNRNTRQNVWIELPDGRRLCLTDACASAGVKVTTVVSRATRQGVSPQAAFNHYVNHVGQMP